MRKPDETKYTRRLNVPVPPPLADAVASAAHQRMTDKSEYVRQALINQLMFDGVALRYVEVR
jgi:hypothetical protein